MAEPPRSSSLEGRIEARVRPVGRDAEWQDYPTVRQLARALRVRQHDVRTAVEGSANLGLIVGVRGATLAGEFRQPGDQRVEWLGADDVADHPSGRRRTVPVVVKVRAAGAEHQVVTVKAGKGSYRREPCPQCPWRQDATGVFPAEAFRHSAGTAYDAATHLFACHDSGASKPAVCAGFLLRGAEHNLAVRMGRATGRFEDDVTDGGHALHASYRAMAVANGVDPDDPALEACRD